MENQLRIKSIPRDHRLLLKKNIVLYGANNSGKTTLLVDLLSIISPYVPNVIAYAPTADSNNSLKDIVPDILIQRTMELNHVKKVYTRQKNAAAAYNNANDPEVLKSLFNRVAGNNVKNIEQTIIQIRDTMLNKLRTHVTDVIERKKQSKKIDTLSQDLLISMYKKVIRSEKLTLLKMKLIDTERNAIKFLDFNPNMVMIFDDCASVLTKKIQNDPLMKDLFFMYRHAYITIIFTFQDDLGLESFLRKNASLSFFTTQQCCDAYFERGSNNFSKEMKLNAQMMSNIIFDKNQKEIPEFSKFLYIRDDPEPFRFYCAHLHDQFRFGSNVLWEYCTKIEKIQRANNAINSNFGIY